MTLSLDDVRNKRFRMARKSGYEVLEVDEFVDEVEETFGQLVEENQNLKRQVESLRSTGSGPAPATSGAAAAATSGPAAPRETIVVTASKEASAAVVRLVELSTDQAERVVEEATSEASRIREEAARSADEVTADAQSRAERVQADARTQAERVQADAADRAERLDREIETRRSQLVGDLEKQRDDLSATVNALRKFEATYRTNLTNHLRSQIESLSSARSEPADAPAGLRRAGNGDAAPARAGGGGGSTGAPEARTEPKPASETPRLDALLGDQR